MAQSLQTRTQGIMSRLQPGRLFTEFLIIVLGVLAALGVDEWRQARIDRQAELQYVDRLITDLLSDSATSAHAATVGALKVVALDGLLERVVGEGDLRASPSALWPDLSFTYARPDLQTTTFDELTSSGALSLVHDQEVRYRIGDHYRSVLHHFDRLDQRRTRLAWTVADIFATISWGSGTQVSPAAIDSTFFAGPNAEVRFQRLLGPEYQGLVNQERVYARSMEEISTDILNNSLDLLAVLRDYRESLD